jgi:hypothetical protein
MGKNMLYTGMMFALRRKLTGNYCWVFDQACCCSLLLLQMVYIAELAQPVCWQTLQAQPKVRPDIQPTLMVRRSCICFIPCAQLVVGARIG